MLLPRIFAPVRGSVKSSPASLIPSSRILDALRTCNAATPTLSFVRNASHQSQGRANGAKDGPGKRLGAKKSGGEYVIPGNIIFRQRGTAWFPGENCKFGRDHCIFATESGYVRYYRDPLKHPKRQYIGVVFEQNQTLPYPKNAARKRRLNMIPVAIEPAASTTAEDVIAAEAQVENSAASQKTARKIPKDVPANNVNMGRGYAYRETNWSIGRVAERSNVRVREFVPGDRWRAWQRSKARIAKNIEQKKLRNANKKATKAKKRR